MKTLKELAESVQKNAHNPHMLAELGVEIAASYAYFTDEMKQLQLEKAVFITNIKFEDEKPKSDSYCEAKWLTEDQGKKEIALKYQIRAYDRLLSSIQWCPNV